MNKIVLGTLTIIALINVYKLNVQLTTLCVQSFICITRYLHLVFLTLKFEQSFCSVSEVHLDTFLAVDTSSSSHYGSRGGLAWTPPASGEGSTPTWTEGTPSFTDSSSSGDLGNWHLTIFNYCFAFAFFCFLLNFIIYFVGCLLLTIVYAVRLYVIQFIHAYNQS